jgi:hypothetical protein
VKNISFSYIKFKNKDDAEIQKIETLLNVMQIENFEAQEYLEFQSESMLKERFGRHFTREVLQLPQAIWSRVLSAKDGLYMVKVEKKIVTDSFEFDNVEGRVYRDYKADFEKRVTREAYKNISKNYSIVVE